MGGPDRPRGRAEQCSGEGLCLKEGGAGGGVSAVVGAVRERVADGGGGCGRNCSQMSRKNLSSQRLTLTLFTQRQFNLTEEEKTQSVQIRGTK